jgi:uncharacterized membrane protein HdeD (DUF308 family)
MSSDPNHLRFYWWVGISTTIVSIVLGVLILLHVIGGPLLLGIILVLGGVFGAIGVRNVRPFVD